MGLVTPSTVGIQWYPYRPTIMQALEPSHLRREKHVAGAM